MNRTDRSPGASGFTLIELLIVLALMSVLMFLSIPPLFQMVQRQKILGAAQQTAMAMRLARLEAIKSSTSTVMRLDPQTSTMLVFVDLNQNLKQDAGEAQVFTMPLPRGVSFGTAQGFTTPPAPQTVPLAVFLNNGSIRQKGAFRFVNTKGDQLEVNVMTDNGNQIKLRKELSGSFYEQGEGGKSWVWK
jgi:prepilin-type N-terminal cleavage/methylation domain-containing protein